MMVTHHRNNLGTVRWTSGEEERESRVLNPKINYHSNPNSPTQEVKRRKESGCGL
jgi:hypothetical protein